MSDFIVLILLYKKNYTRKVSDKTYPIPVTLTPNQVRGKANTDNVTNKIFQKKNDELKVNNLRLTIKETAKNTVIPKVQNP